MKFKTRQTSYRFDDSHELAKDAKQQASSRRAGEGVIGYSATTTATNTRAAARSGCRNHSRASESDSGLSGAPVTAWHSVRCCTAATCGSPTAVLAATCSLCFNGSLPAYI